ncbi:MAG: type II toxin-antitoxin system RelE/ParE family toxin [Chitinophagaceae bacterium]|nr:MAG: type II toxin-antitoxin system RelE/ParE family toxin [Chitinophagaceae bacterium]
MQRSIKWDKNAVLYFSEAIKYIRKDSDVNADNVKRDILEKINELSSRPEIHPPDKFKQYNNGEYRAFELHRYRIAYRMSDTEIIIARVRHTRQEPQEY